MKNDPIAAALNIANIVQTLPMQPQPETTLTVTGEDEESIPGEYTVIPAAETETDTEKDFKIARNNLVDILEKGQQALDELLVIADVSQHPRAYEVIAGLIKTLAETNKDLLNIRKQVKDINNTANAPSANNVTNNNLFVGSTSDLQKFIKQINKK